MSEQELADRFGQDIDTLLRRGEPSEWDAPTDYRSSLDVAQMLASTNYSAESQQRTVVRQRLLAVATERWEREVAKSSDGFWAHPLIALPLALVTLALICALVMPSSAGWERIGQPGIALPAIETPVAAAQTAYAEFRGVRSGIPASVPPTVDIVPTPTQTARSQPFPASIFVATGTPSR